MNPNITLKHKLDFVKSKSVYTRYCLATNPSITDEIADQLFNDDDGIVQIGLCYNQNLSDYMLDKLLNLKNPEIDDCLASNPRTPSHILNSWIKREELAESLASNPNLPVLGIQYLLQSDCLDVSTRALTNPSLPDSIRYKYITKIHGEMITDSRWVRGS